MESSEVYNHPYHSLLLVETQNETLSPPFGPSLIPNDDIFMDLNSHNEGTEPLSMSLNSEHSWLSFLQRGKTLC